MDIKERIITECNKMLMSVGVSSMTMDDVAHACGISKRTLYETFPDKRTLVWECLNSHHETKNAEIVKIFENADNCFDALFKVYARAKLMYENTSVAFVNDIKRLYPDMFEQHINNEKVIVNGLANVLRQAQEQGLVIDRINPEISSYLFLMSMRELHTSSNAEKYGFKLSDLFEHVFISFLRGVATIKGIEMIDYLERKNQKNQ